MFTKRKNIAHILGVSIVAFVMGVSLNFVKGWTEPTVAPPGGNIAAPLNTGATTQIKSGYIGSGSGTSYKQTYLTKGGLLNYTGNIYIQPGAGRDMYMTAYGFGNADDLRVYFDDTYFRGNVNITDGKNLNVDGRIVMKTETKSGDSRNTVATKGYVEDLIASIKIPTSTETTCPCGTCGSTKKTYSSHNPDCGTTYIYTCTQSGWSLTGQYDEWGGCR